MSYAHAQTNPLYETGTKPYGSFEGGDIDSVNLLNGALSLSIPLVDFPQRGGKLRFGLSLQYTNQVFQYTQYSGCNQLGEYCYYWNTPLSPGVQLKPTFVMSFQNDSPPTTPLAVISPDGTSHTLLSSNPGYFSSDGTGYNSTVVRNAGKLLCPYTESVADRDGINYTLKCVTSPSVAYLESYEDPNGNKISGVFDANFNRTGWQDSMLRTLNKPPDPNSSQGATSNLAGCTGNLPTISAYLYSVPAQNGGSVTYKVCYTQVSILLPIALCNSYPYCYVGSGPNKVIQSIVLPNQTAWTFNYDSSVSGSVAYGDLTEVIFPTGGTITYGWQSFYPSSQCYYGNYTQTFSRGIATKTVNANDGTGAHVWTYSQTIPQGTPPTIPPITTTVQDPLGNKTVHTLTGLTDGTNPSTCSFYETQVQYYQGITALLKTINTTYVSSLKTNSSSQIPGLASVVTTIWPNGQQTKIANATYEYPHSQTPNGWPISDGNVTVRQEYGYGSGAPGPLARTTTTVFKGTEAPYLANNLISLPKTVKVTDASGSQVSLTTYGYDEFGLQSSLISTQHDSPAPDGTVRGNQTSVARWLNTTGGTIKSTTTYFDTGMVYVSKDPLNNPTTYAYSSTYAGAYPTAVTNALSQSASPQVYDFNTGLLLTSTDLNSQPIYYTYDNMWRPLTVSYPDGGQSSFSYQESAFPFIETTTTKITSSPSLNKVSTTSFDGLGRPYQSELVSDTPSPSFTVTKYDGLGRTATVYNATRCNPPTTNCMTDSTWGYTSYSYDALGRPSTVVGADLSSRQSSYSGATTTTIDEAQKKRQSTVDALGRIVQVIEDPGGLNYETDYTYDALNNLLTVSQGTSRARSFSYDSLSRLLTANNPESGVVSYTYDVVGNVHTKTDARSLTTTFTYDADNRLLSKTYSNSDPTVSFTYDLASCQGASACFNIGRRTTMADGGGIGGSESWAYDSMGRLIAEHRQTNNVSKNFLFYYNLDGSISKETYPSGETIAYSYDGGAHQTSVQDAGLSDTYATGVVYTPAGQLSTATLGPKTPFAGINLSITYNNRLQTNETKYSSANGTALDISYSFVDPNGHNNGQVATVTNNLHSGRSQHFTYDSINRLTTAQTTATAATSLTDCWGEKYTIDQWGNVSAIGAVSTAYTGCTQESISYIPTSQNRFSSFAYDLSGNTTSDSVHPYTWNAASQLTTAGGLTYNYDGDGNRVEKVGSKIYWYGTRGEILDESDDSGNVTDEYIYLGRKRIAHRVVGGSIFYYASDVLSTSRVMMSATGTTCFDADFYPFGIQRTPYTQACLENYKFTAKERDSESNLDNLGARYYKSNVARYMSPDWSDEPIALPWADLHNPQSLNLYSYVNNGPSTFTDSTGHYCDPDTWDGPTNTLTAGKCYPDIYAVSIVYGHHFVQQALIRARGWNSLAGQFFRRLTTGRLENPGQHVGYSTPHRLNDAQIEQIIDKVEESTEKRFGQWGPDEIEKAVDEVRSAGGDVEAFLSKLAEDNPEARTIEQDYSDVMNQAANAYNAFQQSRAGQVIEEIEEDCAGKPGICGLPPLP